MDKFNLVTDPSLASEFVARIEDAGGEPYSIHFDAHRNHCGEYLKSQLEDFIAKQPFSKGDRTLYIAEIKYRA